MDNLTTVFEEKLLLDRLVGHVGHLPVDVLHLQEFVKLTWNLKKGRFKEDSSPQWATFQV